MGCRFQIAASGRMMVERHGPELASGVRAANSRVGFGQGGEHLKGSSDGSLQAL